MRAPGFLALDHVLDNVLELKQGAQIRTVFADCEVERISDVLSLDKEDLRDMGLSIVNCKRILRLIAWYNELPNPRIEAWFTLNADEFDFVVFDFNNFDRVTRYFHT